MDPADSGSTSELEDHSKSWGSDARSPTPSADDAGSALHPQSDCGIGHRVLASRSVLALVIDEECVFAGLQGGDIVVSRLQLLLSRGFSNLIPTWSYCLEVSSKLFIF